MDCYSENIEHCPPCTQSYNTFLHHAHSLIGMLDLIIKHSSLCSVCPHTCYFHHRKRREPLSKHSRYRSVLSSICASKTAERSCTYPVVCICAPSYMWTVNKIETTSPQAEHVLGYMLRCQNSDY